MQMSSMPLVLVETDSDPNRLCLKHFSVLCHALLSELSEQVLKPHIVKLCQGRCNRKLIY